ncbi:MAG: ABC transporter permease [Acidobacteriia bacterium]|nr:ABC transporter permease [Terriglobia bacterium]
MRKLLYLFRRACGEREIDAELQSYLDALIEEKQRAGMAPAKAERAARIEFGGMAQVKEVVRESHSGAWMDPLFPDVRYGARMLGRNRGFTAVATLTLALGIGANTALFSVTRAFLLRDLPYSDPERLVNVYEIWPHEVPFQAGAARTVSPDFVNWRARGQLFSGLEAYSGGDNATNLTDAGEPERIPSARITAGLPGLLGVQPRLGRSFTNQEDQLGGPPAAILSYGLWQRRFGGSAAAIGKRIMLDGVTATVVGVLPASFVFPDNGMRAEIFVPMALPAQHDWHDERNFRIIHALARVKPGATQAAFQAECREIARSTASEEPAQFATMRRGMQVLVAPLRNRLVGNVRLVLLILEAAVGMVLLIGWLNIANLQIARALSRQKEMALRAALGASRTRLARQLLTESLLLSGLGGAAGLLFGLGSLRYVRAALPANLHLATTIRMDAAVLAFTLGLTLLSGIITGLAPSLSFSTERLEEALKQASSRASESGRHHQLRSALVVAEIAAAMVLLVGAGLLTRSFLRLASVDLGFDPHGVLTVRIPLPERKYPPEKRLLFFSQLLERAQALPGVQTAAIGGGGPLVGSSAGVGTVVDGRPLPPIGGAPTVALAPVSPDYFRTLRMPVLRGRVFTEADRCCDSRIIVINQAFADTFFPGEDALGKYLRFSGVHPGPRHEIVGIVASTRPHGLSEVDSPYMYVPYGQMPEADMLLILRSALPPAPLTAEAKHVIQSLDPDQPVADIATMEERIHTALAEQRTNMVLMGIFAGLALTLAAIGIFGVIAYLVSRRSHEIGIRLALGAQRADILGLVYGQAMRLTVAGIGLGLGGALVGTRVLRNLLYQTQAYDPVTLAAVAALFAVVAMGAVYWPARQAARLDPVVTLRHE